MVAVEVQEQIKSSPLPAERHSSQGIQANGSGGKGFTAEELLKNLPASPISKPLRPTPLSPQAFLTLVTAGLGYTADDLFRYQILIQQDLDDIADGVYGHDQVDAFRFNLTQQLYLRDFITVTNYEAMTEEA